MAVPKKKKSKSRTRQGRAHLAIGKVNVVIDKKTGEYRLPHRLDPSNGEYNNRAIIIKKVASEE